jgi:peptidyl-prolyl cis-trans isomerase SurA
VGWHLIRRVSLKRLDAFETMRRPLADRVKRDSRNEIARQSMVARIQKEGKYQQFPEVLAKWAAKQVDTVFLTFRWKPDPTQPQEVLARYNDKVFTVADFEAYCAQAGRERMRGGGNPVGETIDRLYRSWSDDVAMQFEETQLEKKYPDFKSLMREYEEGILLFEALKINVWDRANADSVGLAKFYNEKLQGKFMWDERARTSLYTVKTDDPKVLEQVRALAAKKPSAEVLKKMNKKTQVVSVMERTYESGRNADLLQNWKKGALTDARTDAGTKTATFLKVEEIIPRTQKALSEARGYAVADYQDYLEKQWIEDLRKQYPVQIDEAAFKTLVKK